MRQLAKAALVAGVVVAGWVGWGLYSTRTTETVPYEHFGTVDGLELRRYPATTLVTTTAPTQREAFRRLFRYISGANEGNESISMTAPVETRGGESLSMTSPVRSSAEGDSVRMAFYLPAAYEAATAPEPASSSVSLQAEPPKTVAVDRFSWYAPSWRVSRRLRALRATLDRHGIEPLGEPFVLRYNAPLTPPFLRRNELAITVDDPPGASDRD
jgi:hypothetical protein